MTPPAKKRKERRRKSNREKKRITHTSCSSRRRRCPTAGPGRPAAATAGAAAGDRAFFYATGRPQPTCPTTSPTCPRASARRLVGSGPRLPPRTRRRRGRAAATHNLRADARGSRVRFASAPYVSWPAPWRTWGPAHDITIVVPNTLLLDTRIYICV